MGLAVYEMEQPDLKAAAELDKLFNAVIHHASVPAATA